MPFVNGKPTSCKPWNKGFKGLQVAWNKGLKFPGQGNGHPNYNTELRGCFKKGSIPWSKGKGKERYWNKPEYRAIRKFVYERDNYTCLSCGEIGGKLNLHHLLPVSLFPEYVYEEKNVITLCVKCHSYTDTWGLRLVRKRDEFKERFSELTLSQVREETLEKVQRLVAEAKVNDHASNCYHELPDRKVRDSLTLQATVRSSGIKNPNDNISGNSVNKMAEVKSSLIDLDILKDNKAEDESHRERLNEKTLKSDMIVRTYRER